MIKIPGKIPITIYPAFWIFAFLIGWLMADFDFISTLVWVGIIFVSVLFHEFGHALTAKMFGQKPRIDLVAMGGLTYHDGQNLPFWKQFIITLNGPLFGFLLVIGAHFLLKVYPSLILRDIRNVNLFWTIINLLPILPLDGGQLMRLVFEKIFKVRGFHFALFTSMAVSLIASLLLFLTQNFFPGALFFLFAFENFDAYRRTKYLKESDRSDQLKKALQEAEAELRLGNKQHALDLFEAVRKEAKEGMIHALASQHLAFLDYEMGKKREAYLALVPLKDRLDPEGICLLHRLAFEENDYQLVFELAGPVFQLLPEAEVALRSAYACASLAQAEAAVGWLQTALSSGVENLKEIVQEKTFDPIRTNPAFLSFIQTL